MSAIEILTIVLLVFASALCIALIIYLGRITAAIKDIQNNLTKVSSDIQPLITSVSDLANKLSEVSTYQPYPNRVTFTLQINSMK